MESKLISIVVPAYNVENSIERCIRSIQDDDVEIVIVVDGATDRTEEICDQLAEDDSRIKLVKQKNQGCVKARRNGIANAIGRYIMSLDSDDCYMDQTIASVRKLIEKYNEPDLIRFRYRKEPEGYEQYRYFLEGEEHFISKEDFPKKIYPMFLEGYQLNSIWCNCVKRELIERLNIKNDVKRYGEDLLVNLELFSEVKNMVLTEEVLYRYITNPESITQTRNIEKLLINLQDCINIYSSFYHYLGKWGIDTEEYRNIVKNRLEKETNQLIKIIQGEFEKQNKEEE